MSSATNAQQRTTSAVTGVSSNIELSTETSSNHTLGPGQ